MNNQRETSVPDATVSSATSALQQSRTFNRTCHTPLSLFFASFPFSISRGVKRWNISLARLCGINKPHCMLTKLSYRSHWRRNRRIFSLKYTFDVWGLCLCSFVEKFFFFLHSRRGPVSGDSPCSRILQNWEGCHQFSKQGQRLFFFHSTNIQLPETHTHCLCQ